MSEALEATTEVSWQDGQALEAVRFGLVGCLRLEPSTGTWVLGIRNTLTVYSDIPEYDLHSST